MSWQVCVTLVSSHYSLWNGLPWLLLFSSLAICTRRTNQRQISMNCDKKCLQKRVCLEIDCHQLWMLYLKERNFRVESCFLTFCVDLISGISYRWIFRKDLFSRISVLPIFYIFWFFRDLCFSYVSHGTLTQIFRYFK